MARTPRAHNRRGGGVGWNTIFVCLSAVFYVRVVVFEFLAWAAILFVRTNVLAMMVEG